MDLIEILKTFGVPSFLFTSVVAIVIYCIKSLKAFKNGMVAMLRNDMINSYNKWHDKGYAPIYARENFEDLFVNYISLGGNGVMKDLHKKFLELPTEDAFKKGVKNDGTN